ncbi:MAG TPA: GGDEF domain-containing protein [Acidimicrobiales bacterium]|nr:GGDEF domain-containing protein [Acidimicrobiales bacterium]
MADRRTTVASSQAALLQRMSGARAVAVGWGVADASDRRWLAVAPPGVAPPPLTSLPPAGPLTTVVEGTTGPPDGAGTWRIVVDALDDQLEVLVAVAPADALDDDALAPAVAAIGTVLAVELRAAWLDEVVRRSTDVVVIRDAQLRIRWVSPQVTASLGWEPEDLVGLFGDHLGHPDELHAAAELLVEHAEGRGDFPPRRFRLAHREGGWRWFELGVSNLLDDPAVLGFVVVGRDVTAEVEATERLEAALTRLSHAAHHDPLTRLPNRVALTERLRAVVAGERGPGEAAVLFCDLDGFKEVNDDHGHEAGDRFLGVVGAHIRAAVRADDLVARYGGDEFVVVAVGLEGESEAVEVGERVLDAVRRSSASEWPDHTLSASIGVVMVDGHRSSDDLLRAADAAMYAAKFRGGDRVWLPQG